MTLRTNLNSQSWSTQITDRELYLRNQIITLDHRIAQLKNRIGTCQEQLNNAKGPAKLVPADKKRILESKLDEYRNERTNALKALGKLTNPSAYEDAAISGDRFVGSPSNYPRSRFESSTRSPVAQRSRGNECETKQDILKENVVKEEISDQTLEGKDIAYSISAEEKGSSILAVSMVFLAFIAGAAMTAASTGQLKNWLVNRS